MTRGQPPTYPVPEQVYLFHVTHLRNLPRIVASEGLKSYNALYGEDIEYVDIAHDNIQSRRARTEIPCGAGGTLHDYVPFYFSARSPMLYAIHKGNVEGYSEGQRPVVHLVTRLVNVKEAGCAYVFADGHGIMAFTKFYDDCARLDRVDFPLMKEKYWRDTNADPDRSRRRQAEFLVRDFLPWSALRGIGVINQSIKNQVDALLQKAGAPLDVRVLPRFYY